MYHCLFFRVQTKRTKKTTFVSHGKPKKKWNDLWLNDDRRFINLKFLKFSLGWSDGIPWNNLIKLAEWLRICYKSDESITLIQLNVQCCISQSYPPTESFLFSFAAWQVFILFQLWSRCDGDPLWMFQEAYCKMIMMQHLLVFHSTSVIFMSYVKWQLCTLSVYRHVNAKHHQPALSRDECVFTVVIRNDLREWILIFLGQSCQSRHDFL